MHPRTHVLIRMHVSTGSLSVFVFIFVSPSLNLFLEHRNPTQRGHKENGNPFLILQSYLLNIPGYT